jgi:hypothetical protein
VTHPDTPDVTTSSHGEPGALKAVVRRNTEQVQGQGDFALFDELFADDFVDHSPQFLGIAPTGKTIQFETVDAMRVRNGKSPTTGE